MLLLDGWLACNAQNPNHYLLLFAGVLTPGMRLLCTARLSRLIVQYQSDMTSSLFNQA